MDERDRTTTLRRRLLLVGWLAAAGVVLGRAAELQVLEAAHWKEEALRQHRSATTVPAPRGAIRDRNGSLLAVSHETVGVAIDPQLVQNAEETAELLAETLEIPLRDARNAVRSKREWVPLRGSYPPSVRVALGRVKGVFLEPRLSRFRPHDDLARGLLGTVTDGMGAGGIEQQMDSILRGRPGRRITARDGAGTALPGGSWLVEAPRPGGEVVLTLDLDLQEIGYEALRSAIERHDADGGDLIILEPDTGEILAMVSLDARGGPSLSAINRPYEPGSTLKPFTVAALLSYGLASLSDSVDAGEGHWTVRGRTLRDIRAYGMITLGQALEKSSNIGIAKTAQSLSPKQQFVNLRDFGFGLKTGIPLPSEANGILRRPEAWSGQSPVSLAIGYEIGVTPLQMALAYGALANGGTLMEPRLIREVRGPSGELLQQYRPRAVRRVVSPRVARQVTEVLEGVVQEGTGTRARLSTFRVAGKSGTSRAFGEDGRYEENRFFSSFVGFFPADDPQLVIFVKLDRPRREGFYGGATAAPVTRATMEAVLAARRPPLDRSALASHPRGQTPALRDLTVRFASLGPDPRDPVALPPDPAVAGDRLAVPDVSGYPVRVAARLLHAHGFRVAAEGSGPVASTRPRAGARLAPGDTVRLVSRGGDR